MKHQHEFRDVAQELTDRVIAMIEDGDKVPWKREWDSSKCAGPQAPVNAFTGEMYHGTNAMFFGLDPRAILSADPRWATFKQAADEHCHVKKGAKSVLGIYYKPLEIEDEKAKDGTRVVPLLKTFHAFHASEIEGLPPYKAPGVDEAPWTRPEAVTIIMKNSGITYRTGGDRAFYSPALDIIQTPPDIAFPALEYWASVIVHETNHGTGHPTRLNRDLTGKFGSHSNACEEARLEMATTFVCNTLNLPTDFDNSAVYIAGWLKKLHEDKRELFRCTADAQKIADYTLAWHPGFAASNQQYRAPEPPRPARPSPVELPRPSA